MMVASTTVPSCSSRLFSLKYCSTVLKICSANLVPFYKMAERQDGGGSGMLSLGNRWEIPFWLSPGFSKALL